MHVMDGMAQTPVYAEARLMSGKAKIPARSGSSSKAKEIVSDFSLCFGSRRGERIDNGINDAGQLMITGGSIMAVRQATRRGMSVGYSPGRHPR